MRHTHTCVCVCVCVLITQSWICLLLHTFAYFCIFSRSLALIHHIKFIKQAKCFAHPFKMHKLCTIFAHVQYQIIFLCVISSLLVWQLVVIKYVWHKQHTLGINYAYLLNTLDIICIINIKLHEKNIIYIMFIKTRWKHAKQACYLFLLNVEYITPLLTRHITLLFFPNFPSTTKPVIPSTVFSFPS